MQKKEHTSAYVACAYVSIRIRQHLARPSLSSAYTYTYSFKREKQRESERERERKREGEEVTECVRERVTEKEREREDPFIRRYFRRIFLFLLFLRHLPLFVFTSCIVLPLRIFFLNPDLRFCYVWEYAFPKKM